MSVSNNTVVGLSHFMLCCITMKHRCLLLINFIVRLILYTIIYCFDILKVALSSACRSTPILNSILLTSFLSCANVFDSDRRGNVSVIRLFLLAICACSISSASCLFVRSVDNSDTALLNELCCSYIAEGSSARPKRKRDATKRTNCRNYYT